MDYRRLDNDQARQQIDAQQLFATFREARAALARDFGGYLRWRKIKRAEYLIRTEHGKDTSLGRRCPETELTLATFKTERQRLRDRKDKIAANLKRMDKINVAHRLGRVPDLPARIMDALDRASLMGSGVVVVGTHALFAYEAMAGVHFNSGVVATKDFDLLLEAKSGIELAGDGDRRKEIMAALVAADRSFVPQYGEFAINDEGFEVDFLEEEKSAPAPLSGPAAEAIAIGHTGRPVRMAVPMPAAFAKHKAWLAKQPTRNPLKRVRDAAQAVAIKEALGGYVPPAIIP